MDQAMENLLEEALRKNGLHYLGKPNYADHGESDEEGYQIFTPGFIVEGMVKAIGKKEVLNFERTILEPTSGDGAFTCRILEMRLKTIKEDFAKNALKALSTIYSIEMDEGLIKKQRDNVWTIMVNYALKKKIAEAAYFACAEDIILTNFLWAKTNVEDSLDTLFGKVAVAYPMPEDTMEPVSFYSWKIHDDLTYEKREEEVEI